MIEIVFFFFFIYRQIQPFAVINLKSLTKFTKIYKNICRQVNFYCFFLFKKRKSIENSTNYFYVFDTFIYNLIS